MPKIAVSRPAGYGPFSGLPLTKWVAAVRIALGRPGSASAFDGMSSDFLNMNIGRSPAIGHTYIGRISRFGTVAAALSRHHATQTLHDSASRLGPVPLSARATYAAAKSDGSWRPYDRAEDPCLRVCFRSFGSDAQPGADCTTALRPADQHR